MKILIGYDGSANADGALHDLELAGIPDRAEVLVLTESPPWVALISKPGLLLDAKAPYPEKESDSRRQAARIAATGAAQLRARFPGWKVKSKGDALDPAVGLLEVAKKWKPDLIVLGSRGSGTLTRLFLGSVSQRILHHAATDVRITRPRLRAALGPPRILIGMDGSRGSMGAVSAMAARSWPKGSKVRILAALTDLLDPGAIPDPEKYWRNLARRRRARLDRLTAKAAGRLASAGLDVDVVFRAGDPRECLLKEAKAWRADTIGLGSRGLGALRRFLIGSVSSMVAVHAPCTVEVIRKHRVFRGGKNPKEARA